MERKICEHFKECGACTELNVDYKQQLRDKQKFVADCFIYEGIDCKCSECEPSEQQLRYRNKVHLSLNEDRGRTFIGFSEEDSTRICDIKGCLLHGEWVNFLVELTRTYVKSFKITAYNKYRRSGILRYVVARKLNNSIMVTLVVTTLNFAGKDWFYDRLKEEFKNVSLYLNINRRTDSAVFDKQFIFKKGSPYLQGEMLGVKYSLSPNSFFQVNEKQAETMYKKVVSLVCEDDIDNVIDLYSGIGITSALLARQNKKVFSIEYSSSSVSDARHLIKENSVEDVVKCYEGRCEDVITKLNVEGKVNVFLDPAKMGSDRLTLKAIRELKPNRIVYMSCDPESLARDVKSLMRSGLYRIIFLKPYDMFPQTRHIETLVCLEKF